MEEMRKMGFCEVNDSSELQIRGGVSLSVFTDILTKVKAMVIFISDYIPKLVKGFTDGFTAVSA